ncbi:MAG TPA: branched-chain amino acid ABC transporter permease [Xanthobacteraceae bacterium]|jgi:branched-chain amino acid transport system permease protein|nr:branched-chain amino acid ABC transporter permease [Xanthobacteraceae bacterium]
MSSVELTLAVNSIALGGLLFLLSSGFSLIFGLMRIPNLMHGSFFMLGGYFGVTLLDKRIGLNFWLAALISAVAMGIIGGFIERVLLRRLNGQELPQVLLTLGLSFIVADISLMIWTGDPWQPATPNHLRGALQVGGMFFPYFRLAVVMVAVVIAIALWVLVDWTRLGAMIRAGVDDAPIARVIGIKVSQLFTLIFALGAALAGFAGVVGAPILSVYPGLDAEMLPLALIIVILGGTGSLLGALVGSFIIGFLYNFGLAKAPDLAYVILFLPMLLVLVLRPQGLFGRPLS